MVNTSTQEQTNLPNNNKELRHLYGVSAYIWRTWLEPLSDFIPKHTQTYTPIQLQKIIEELGYPKPKNIAKNT